MQTEPHACECGRAFGSEHALKIHAARAHRVVEEATYERPVRVTKLAAEAAVKDTPITCSGPTAAAPADCEPPVAAPAPQEPNAPRDIEQTRTDVWRQLARDYQMEAIRAYARLARAHVAKHGDHDALQALDELLQVAS